MPGTGIPTQLIWQIEDDIAVQHDALSALTYIELAFRALQRRGYIDPDDGKELQRAIDAVERALTRKLDYASHLRANPREAIER